MFFYIPDFWAACACPETQSVPWIHCIEYIVFIIQDFWANCAWPEKQFPWNFPCAEIFLSFWIFEELALALENRVCPELNLLNIYFLSFRIFEQLALSWKQSCPQIFHCIEYVFLSFRIFEQLALDLKNRVAPEFSLCWNIFIIQDFWGTRACPEK